MSNAGCPSGRFLPLERRSDGEVPDPRGFPGILGKAVTILQADRPDRQIDAYAEPHRDLGGLETKAIVDGREVAGIDEPHALHGTEQGVNVFRIRDPVSLTTEWIVAPRARPKFVETEGSD